MKNRLKELRMENNLTLRELGKQLRMKNSTLSQYEMERREPKIEIWKKIANFFHVPTEYVMGLTNDRVTVTINDLNLAEQEAYVRIITMLKEDYSEKQISRNKIGRLLVDTSFDEEN
ncbi:MAG: helix-turn-helix transcriptional regulator [Lactobacillus sp.]|uniref:helix-turn-helix domain-containing protein n=1 Tax=Lactobacillus sp. TaxID=1591 RepID=UPI0023CB6BDB|nr:helix-turn-helix transcriptional regulator [Lactobacillus sp.]MDE7049918.1 helix-turn-helix transcriptional regulator [Lactobacillus sp.]